MKKKKSLLSRKYGKYFLVRKVLQLQATGVQEVVSSSEVLLHICLVLNLFPSYLLLKTIVAVLG